MERFGIPELLIELTKLAIGNSKCKVRVNGAVSDPFEVKTGVRQGDGISPTLFNIALEEALQKVNKADGGITIGKKINILAFADDVVIIAETLQELEDLTKIVIQETSEVGLKINESKTKFMNIKRGSRNDINHIKIKNLKFDRVSSFKYLGVTVTENNDEDVEIQARLSNANRSFYACKKLLTSKLLSQNTKIRLYKTIIRPVLMYGSESWIMSKKTQKKLVTFENKILRKVYGPSQENGVWRIKHNREIRELFNQEDIVAEARSSRLRWAGHILRSDEDTNVRQVWGNKPVGSRPRGRPKQRWWDQVVLDMRLAGVTEEDAPGRVKWRRRCGEAKYRLGYKWPWE